MVFDIKLSDKARKHRKELNPEIQELVDDAIEEIKEKGLNHGQIGFLTQFPIDINS